jgi:hypothetical protein
MVDSLANHGKRDSPFVNLVLWLRIDASARELQGTRNEVSEKVKKSNRCFLGSAKGTKCIGGDAQKNNNHSKAPRRGTAVTES